jgi:hypothetical protein
VYRRWLRDVKGCSDDEVDELSEKEFSDSPSEEEPSREQVEEESDDEHPEEEDEEDWTIEEEDPQEVHNNEGEKHILPGEYIYAEEDIVGTEYIPGEENNKPSIVDDDEVKEPSWCGPNCRKKRSPERKPRKEKRRHRRKHKNHK